jgi:hypothetical protein
MAGRFVHSLQPDRQRTVESFPCRSVTHLDRAEIDIDQLRLRAKLLGQQPLDLGPVDLEQSRERSHIEDVLHQRSLATGGEVLHRHLPERNPQIGHVGSQQRGVQRPGGIVE